VLSPGTDKIKNIKIGLIGLVCQKDMVKMIVSPGTSLWCDKARTVGIRIIKMSQYWKVENTGHLDPNSIFLFGCSNKDKSEDPRTIGLFGSGSKNMISLFIRNGIFPVIFSGKLRIEYKVKPIFISGVMHQQIFAQLKGVDENGKTVNREEDLKLTTNFGKQDWKNVTMGVREIVSNGLDALFDQGKNHKDLKIELVDEAQVRAKNNHTRVFLPASSPEINYYFMNLGENFLHFSEVAKELEEGVQIIEKSKRSEEVHEAKMYRRGVFVRKMTRGNMPALFDYNLNNIQLDESRTINDYAALSESARALSNASENILVKYFQSFDSGQNYLEHHFDPYYLSSNYGVAYPEQRAARWRSAWVKAHGDAVVVTTDHGKSICERKGIKTVRIPAQLQDTFNKFEIKNELNVLNEFEQNDLTLSEATDDVIKIADFIWDYLQSKNRTNGKNKPTFKTFTKGMNAGSITFGFYKNNVVAINSIIAEGVSLNLITTVLEEIIHHTSGSMDETRDFQDACLSVAAALLQDLYNKK
jgi:hypothetical protein